MFGFMESVVKSPPDCYDDTFFILPGKTHDGKLVYKLAGYSKMREYYEKTLNMHPKWLNEEVKKAYDLYTQDCRVKQRVSRCLLLLASV